jgi:hypothetical protein
MVTRKSEEQVGKELFEKNVNGGRVMRKLKVMVRIKDEKNKRNG